MHGILTPFSEEHGHFESQLLSNSLVMSSMQLNSAGMEKKVFLSIFLYVNIRSVYTSLSDLIEISRQPKEIEKEEERERG